jgi:hypothetical protein
MLKFDWPSVLSENEISSMSYSMLAFGGISWKSGSERMVIRA